MSKAQPSKRASAPHQRAAARRRSSVRPVVTVVLAAGLLVGIWVTRPWQAPRVPQPPSAATNGPAAAAAEAAKSTADSKFTRLVGRWERPDGGYVLEIRSVDDHGLMEAAYLNPNPIHVEKAAALREAGIIKVYVVLRDINYPGSTYTLAYDPSRDVLQGVYFQAVQQQNFEVAFQRLK
jgi:hypothetical protein